MKHMFEKVLHLTFKCDIVHMFDEQVFDKEMKMSALTIPPVYGTGQAQGMRKSATVMPSVKPHLYVVPDTYAPSPQRKTQPLASTPRVRSPKIVRGVEVKKTSETLTVDTDFPDMDLRAGFNFSWKQVLVIFMLAVLAGCFRGNIWQASEATVAFTTTQVSAGESLWSIAAEIAGDNEVSEVVSEIKELNNLSSTELQVGQSLLVPVK